MIKLTDETDPTHYRRIYERLVRVLPIGSRPTKAEFADAILSEPDLYQARAVMAASLWKAQSQSVHGSADVHRRPRTTRGLNRA